MAKLPKLTRLSRREREIMDILYRLKGASVSEVRRWLAGQPNYSTVRAQLNVLEQKGYVRHLEHGTRYVYVPLIPQDVAGRSALQNLVETFFDGSVEQVVATLLGGAVSNISANELDRISRLISKSKKKEESRQC